jgi:hypothetical protein
MICRAAQARALTSHHNATNTTATVATASATATNAFPILWSTQITTAAQPQPKTRTPIVCGLIGDHPAPTH